MTKKVMISNTVSREMERPGQHVEQFEQGNRVVRLTSNQRIEVFIRLIRFRAVSPNTENHRVTDGDITPNTNWRMVRPRLILRFIQRGNQR